MTDRAARMAHPMVRLRIWSGVSGGPWMPPCASAQTWTVLPARRPGGTSVVALRVRPPASVKRTSAG